MDNIKAVLMEHLKKPHKENEKKAHNFVRFLQTCIQCAKS